MESDTISKNIDTHDDRDFSFLRSEGLKHIKAMSRKLWTDYNIHDPGITLLEVLCYAITDLGNRIQLPVQDLLAKKNGETDAEASSFPTAKQILTTAPVSAADYRKLCIDIEGVNNAFIHINNDYTLYRHCSQQDEATEAFPQGKLSFDSDLSPDYKKKGEFTLKGLYTILFEPTADIRFLSDEKRKMRINKIRESIEERYHANRNLCEDLTEIAIIDFIKVLICGDIELERNADATEVLAEILFRIQQYLSPSVGRYTLEQLLDKGIAVENIYEGPVLDNGFILDQELEEAKLKKEIHLSDLVQIVTKTPGVANIRKLRLANCGPKSDDLSVTKWSACVQSDVPKILRLCVDRSIRTLNLFKDVIPIDVEAGVIKQRLTKKNRAYQKDLELSYDDLSPEKGNYMEVEAYTTVQNDLPQLYGTGKYGLSPSLPPQRHAKAKQLKGFLLFFDQILASYFGQLRNIGQLLSAEIGDQTYVSAPIQNVDGFGDLIKNNASYLPDVQELLKGQDDYINRKDRFLDHLLARFAENMNEYAFAMLQDFGSTITGDTLEYKATLLKEYPEISYHRFSSFNYHAGAEKAWDTENVAGLKHRLCRLLGIRDYARRDIITYDYEIYQEHDDDAYSELRWRVLDENGHIMLSSSMHYQSQAAAEKEMWTAIMLAADKQHYQLLPTASGDKYYFNIIDEYEEVVARHIQYYPQREEAEDKIAYIVNYLSTKISEDGLFVFENILFRPDRKDADRSEKLMPVCMDKDCTQCKPQDPYSLQLIIVLPGWTQRFSNLYFREYAEKLIRKEVPAHLLCRICWIGNVTEMEEEQESTLGGPMSKLEDLYKKWLIGKMENPEDQSYNEHLKQLVDLLHNLETVYPAGRLYDCSTGGEGESPITLGKSTIGELKTQDHGNE